MPDNKERLMVDRAKEAEKASGEKTMDKPADNPTSVEPPGERVDDESDGKTTQRRE